MPEPREPHVLEDGTLLLRRASDRALERVTEGVKPLAFRLRASQAEKSLSFYDASMVTAADVLAGAPRPGWGVAALSVLKLRDLGFIVEREPVPEHGPLGLAHVSATPPELDEEQIPVSLIAQLVAAAEWAIKPSGD